MIEMKIPQLNSPRIRWNGFLENIVKRSRELQESCAWIFVDMKNDIWNVMEVKNIGLKGKPIEHTFAPEKKDFARVKRIARKNRWTRIGNIHTHVVKTRREAYYQLRPSDADLKYARRYNDVVRGIIVVQFTNDLIKGKIYGIIWIDQYGAIMGRELFDRK